MHPSSSSADIGFIKTDVTIAGIMKSWIAVVIKERKDRKDDGLMMILSGRILGPKILSVPGTWHVVSAQSRLEGARLVLMTPPPSGCG